MRWQDSFAKACRSFGAAERGNVAMMFAIILPVLITAVGAAIDYTRASKVRASMQSAIDATALMISKEAADLTPDQLNTKAQAYFNALFPSSEVTGVTFTSNYSVNSGNGASVTLGVSATWPTEFMKFANIVLVPLTASSTTRWGNIRYRVALALDNTGSMASSDKMNQLKIATNQLINDFYNMAGSNEDVYISIVPFAKDVNIGTDKVDSTWLNWSDWDSKNTHKVCTKPAYTTKTTCQNNGGNWISVADPHSSWNGCVMDRTQSYDINAVDPTSAILDSKPLPEQYTQCPVSILGMTSVKTDKQALLNKVAAMSPSGNTNQSIGLAWAWLTHSTTGPFTAPSKSSSSTYMDVIILLTDGLNTENRWSTNQNTIDARQSMLCDNAKTAGVKIFAVQVATGGDPVSTMLQNCTSAPSNPNYFSYITQASQMTVKFQAIFKELAKLRLSV